MWLQCTHPKSSKTDQRAVQTRERRRPSVWAADELCRIVFGALFWRLFNLVFFLGGALLKQPFGTFWLEFLGTVWQSELGEPLAMHSEQQLKLSRQLVRLLPLGGKLGSLFVIVMVWKILPCVGVKSERPESIQVDLFTDCRRQSVHEDACAQPFGWQVFVFPVPGKDKYV